MRLLRLAGFISDTVSACARNRAGEVFKAAIQAGDLAVAENSLTAEWGQESLYGGRVRLFASQSLQALLKAASLAVLAERGVRVMADYLPAADFSAALSTSEFLSLSASWGAGQSLPPSRAINNTWQIVQVPGVRGSMLREQRHHTACINPISHGGG